MMKIKMLLLLLLFPIAMSAQLIGVGAQYATPQEGGNAIQLAGNLSYPVWHKKNSLRMFVSSGIDYTGGSTPVSGLNIKPIQLSTFLDESLFNNNKITLLLGCDAGYIFNFKYGKDGIVITPNVMIDYNHFYLKAGYDMNVTGNEQQFFVRLGLCLSVGSFKSYAKTEIW